MVCSIIAKNAKKFIMLNTIRLIKTSKKQKKHEWRKERKKWLSDFKEGRGCSYCDEKDGCCLDFHHTNGDKDGNISEMVFVWSEQRLMKEIAKCEIICSNCHRKLHAGRKLVRFGK